MIFEMEGAHNHKMHIIIWTYLYFNRTHHLSAYYYSLFSCIINWKPAGQRGKENANLILKVN